MWRCEISTASTGSIVGAATRRRRWTTRLVRIGSVMTRKPSTSSTTVACPTQVIVSSGCCTTHSPSAVDRVEVVVDGDPADAHRVGDVLDRSPQDERALGVEQADGALLVLAGQRRQRPAELGLDRVDQAVERAVQGRHAHRRDHVAVPHQRHVGGLLLRGGHERRAHGVEHRLDRAHDRVRFAVHRPLPPPPSASISATSMLTCVAPFDSAAETIAATTSPARSLEVTHPEPKGPKSTSIPSARNASSGSVTWRPGLPSTKGSTVNSTRCTVADGTRSNTHSNPSMYGPIMRTLPGTKRS